jgi:integrase
MKFTQANVTKIRSPSAKPDHWEPDDLTPGFGIRFRNGGDGVYGIRYGIAGRDRRLSYEKVSKVTLADARAWAKRQHASVAERIDPAVVRARAVAKASDSIEPLMDDFIAYLGDNGRSASYLQENERSLKRYFKPLHRFSAADINRAMVARELARIRSERGPIAGDRSRAHLSKFFAWCIGEGLAENNPVHGTNKIGSKARERVLSDAELAAIWKQLDDDDDYGAILKLLILTGARRDEIGSLSRSEINFAQKQIELPGSRTKNGLDHIVPLAPAALSILKSRELRDGRNFIFGRGEGGFSGWSQSKERLDSKLPIFDGWVLHDFRRTLSTVMHERLKIAPHIVEAVLNHVSGARAGVAGIYNRAVYLADKRAALNAYADYVAGIIKDNHQ